MRTFSPKIADVKRDWYVIDADGLVLGRLASEVARLLRGKHKPIFAPHLDTGDFVIVINSDKVVMTAGKASEKVAYRHSGYPGGLKRTSYTEMLSTNSEEVIRKAVKGMLPKGPLGRSQLRKLKVYKGPEHGNAAQKPVPLQLSNAARGVQNVG